ncbi:galactokinase [Longimicrobium terrae]|uniref:Galactokinase n=1 Tax=Longimicrobium terrae TaxID=1639882 RepID=A0A841GWM8_9BACT|nr:galactokinase [Longimicrobium terrae]MBB4635759.1 galactokinase [Longimicrobium terrae]MBB6070153.1 galactokinase [Longimicrobium terrae]NNC33054.1 galactokinase [Longimicrobium terrae]
MTSDNGLRSAVVRAFEERYGGAPAFVARAPGRVNLIGEHTDYNDGFVLPMAIDRAVWIALRPREDYKVRIHSLDFDEEREFDLMHLASSGMEWMDYVQAVAWALQKRDRNLKGWDGVTAGDVPIGAGLSSSAAFELASARAFAALSGLHWEPREMALMAQRAENEWIGVYCGIMDQMISAAGEAGHALLIDCRSLETRSVPVPAGTSVVILDTATRRGLVDSAYNDRRRHCEEAAAALGVPALRDVTRAKFEARAESLPPLIRKRARHVVTEIERTLEAAEALERNDAARVGDLMNASHASLRDDFEVSRRELDVIVELAQAQGACYGARMTGAGFGGCAVALVQTEGAEAFAASVAADYQRATDLEARVYVCSASEGASLEQMEYAA